MVFKIKNIFYHRRFDILSFSRLIYTQVTFEKSIYNFLCYNQKLLSLQVYWDNFFIILK